MYKSYTIKSYKYKEISKGKGSIAYQLVDELGEERIVTAMANCGLMNKIKSIHPIHHRETPLIKILANSAINDTIVVDFSDFNKKFPRVHSDFQFKKSARRMIKHIDEAHTASNFSDLTVDKYRVLQLFVIACLAWMAIIVLMNL